MSEAMFIDIKTESNPSILMGIMLGSPVISYRQK